LSLGLRQIDVARHLGITEGAYNRYETGIRVPRPKHAIRLAELYKVSLNDIYGVKRNDKAVDA
jgi:transcriptional regulator with XRE-family HTH domain